MEVEEGEFKAAVGSGNNRKWAGSGGDLKLLMKVETIEKGLVVETFEVAVRSGSNR